MSPLEDNEASQTLPTSIVEQYKDAAYSDFVQANQDFYYHYLHYSFFRELEALPNPPRYVLDMGCGNGILSRKLWRPSMSIYGVDLMDPMLDRARSLCRHQGIPLLEHYSQGANGIYLDQANLLDPTTTDRKIPKAHFDVAMSGFVLAHMATAQELDTVLQLAHNSLKPGGLSLHIIPATFASKEGQVFRAELPHDKPIVLYDVHWNDSTYVESMQRAGFVEVTIQELEYHPDTTKDWKRDHGHPEGYKLLKGWKATTAE